MSFSILTTQLSFEHDVVLVRQRARQIAKLLGFDAQDQTRIATAVSEIARNALNYVPVLYIFRVLLFLVTFYST